MHCLSHGIPKKTFHHDTTLIQGLGFDGTYKTASLNGWQVPARRTAGWEHAFKRMLQNVVFHPDDKVVCRKDDTGKHTCGSKTSNSVNIMWFSGKDYFGYVI